MTENSVHEVNMEAEVTAHDLNAKQVGELMRQHLGVDLSRDTLDQCMRALPGMMDQFRKQSGSPMDMMSQVLAIVGKGSNVQDLAETDAVIPLLEALQGLGKQSPREVLDSVKQAVKDGNVRDAVKLVFRQPTIRNEGERIGRNDPCPCGCGKKVKKCPNKKQA